MAGNDTDMPGTRILERVLDELRELDQSPVGRVIRDQIARLVTEHADSQQRLQGIYNLVVHLLLDAYARGPTAEHVTRLSARLLELRGEETTPTDRAESAAPAQAQVPAGPAAAKAFTESPSPSAGEAGDDEPHVERRVNSAYRLHLNRKRDEIEKLQEALAKNVAETISQNREFGALLQIELRALQQADGEQEVEDLRQILVGGIEELIQGQRKLDSKLARTADYLNIVKNDSDRLRDELHKVRLLSLTDEFTGLPNRRAFVRRLQDETGRAVRYGSSLALALIDLDSFKTINDSLGHAAGDEVLRAYAVDVLSILRHHDLAARYGGEEFAILLPNTNQDGAVAALNKVRLRAREVQYTHAGSRLALPTFSAGVTTYAPGEAYTAFIDRADRALYRAKHLGRNRIEIEAAPVGATADELSGETAL